MMGAPWDELDVAARANLDSDGLKQFHTYKAELFSEGEPWDEAYDTLSGFIWCEIE